ncbi:MAG: hypothetical protein LUI02_02215 [Clostridiales bacterium]|nr:hypothetical protein [Clostridiales bacterium]
MTGNCEECRYWRRRSSATGNCSCGYSDLSVEITFTYGGCICWEQRKEAGDGNDK